MRFIIVLLLSMMVCFSGYAYPAEYKNGNYTDPIVYVGSIIKNGIITYDIYTSKQSLDSLPDDIYYNIHNIWSIDIYGEPITDTQRSEIIDKIINSSRVVWYKTDSGSKKFWAVKSEIVYNPTKDLVVIHLPESYINDNGELMGKSSKDIWSEEYKYSNLKNHSGLKIIVDIVNKYLNEHYPRINPNAKQIE